MPTPLCLLLWTLPARLDPDPTEEDEAGLAAMCVSAAHHPKGSRSSSEVKICFDPWGSTLLNEELQKSPVWTLKGQLWPFN